ncbi:MAG: AI-2E family transporter [Shewanella sp.]
MAPIFTNAAVGRTLLILLLCAGVFFFIDFLVPALAALIVCFSSWPLYQKLLAKCAGRSALAASIALIFIVLGLITPLFLVFSYAIQEIKLWLDWLIYANQHGAAVPQWIKNLPLLGEWLTTQWQMFIGEPHELGKIVTAISGQNLTGISRGVLLLGWNTLGVLLTLLFMLITLFFLYKDGEVVAKQLDIVGERVLPARWHSFSRVVPATVSSTVIGMTLIAIGEGIILGIAYWIAGVPSAIAFGVLTAFMALIPGGAPTMFTLISLYLVGTGDMAAGVGLFLWGSIELFIVDKTLRPNLVGGPIKLPFLPTFFGLIGGVKTMGFVGLFVGPVLMALLVAIWREWLKEEPETVDITDS